MELTTYSECACANCGNVIDYRASRAGEVIQCGKCGVKSQLPQARKLEMIERFGPPIPEIKHCETCATPRPFFVPDCPVCEKSRRRARLARRLMVGAGIAALVGVFGLVATLRHPKNAAARSYGTYLAGSAGLALPHSGTMIIQQPKTLSKYGGGLIVGKFDLEHRRGSDLTVAVGDIVNDSEKVRHGLRADVDLLNRNGVRIGTVSDYMSELGPHQSWHFISEVQYTNAVLARFVQITESN